MAWCQASASGSVIGVLIWLVLAVIDALVLPFARRVGCCWRSTRCGLSGRG
jgi:hypothetical protein